MAKKIKSWRGLLGQIIAIATGGTLLGAGAAVLVLATALPRRDGRVAVPGLAAAVEIARDADGVPHILASDDADAYFGLGFAHAQDRLWQMEFNRRLVAGRLAEVLGPPALETDRFFRTLGLWRHAEMSVRIGHFDGATRRALDAYARGVNAFLAQHRGAWPPEFVLLRTAPRAWQPADSVALIELMSVLLSGNMFAELDRAAWATRLSPAQRAQFEPREPATPTTMLGALDALYRQLALPGAPAWLPPGGASNNWVVAGGRSVTGKPLLANDTHLPLTAPSLFYLAHLGMPDGNVVGASLPGVPGIILGRTDHIAWGFTTTNADVQDLYVEQTDPADPDRYLTPGGWARFLRRQEVIAVRGAPSETLTVRTSRHGPLLPADLLARRGLPGQALALRWTLYERPDTTIAAAIHLVRARSWPDFVAALRPFVAPMQNIVYADRDGHIGFIAPALIPVRLAQNPARGHAPVPGWQVLYDWQGFVPFDALPRAADPPSGMLYTANNRIVGPRYPYFLTDDWDALYRAERIRALLEATPRHDLASFARMQQDVLSPLARDFLPILIAAAPASPIGRAAQRLMPGWDGRMTADAPQPLIFIAWLRALARTIYADELGPLFEPSWQIRPLFLRNVLRPGAPEAAWCDDVTRPAREDCGGRVGLALDQAAAELARDQGGDPAAWRWGRVHVARNVHRPFDAVPALRRLFDVTVESPGGPYTLDRGLTEFASERPYANAHAAAFRGLYDLAAPDRSRFMIPTGQSGNPLSADYRRFARGWAEGRTIPIVTNRAALERAARHRLTLVPGR